MFFGKAIFCRVLQTAFRIVLPVLPCREPEIIRSCTELGGIVQKEKMKSGGTPQIVNYCLHEKSRREQGKLPENAECKMQNAS